MFTFIHNIAEERIRRAEEEGQFRDLEGSGRPLALEDDSHVPPDLRMAYKVLRNAGYLPPELQQDKEIRNAIDLLEHMEDEQERYRQLQKVNVLISRMDLRRDRPVNLRHDDEYFRLIVEKVEVAKKKAGEDGSSGEAPSSQDG